MQISWNFVYIFDTASVGFVNADISVNIPKKSQFKETKTLGHTMIFMEHTHTQISSVVTNMADDCAF